MNLNQIAEINTFLDAIDGIDIDKGLAKTYSNERDFKQLRIGTFTVFDFKRYTRRFPKQLRSELKQVGDVLPLFFYHNNGNYNLHEEISYFKTYLQGEDYGNAAARLERLVYYQILHGFWDRSAIKLHTPGDEMPEALLSDLKLQQVQIEDLVDALQTKQAELVSLTTDLQNARSNISQINTLLGDAKGYSASLEELQKGQQERTRDAGELLAENRKRFEDEFVRLTGNFDKMQEDLKKIKATGQGYSEALREIVETKETVEGYEDQIRSFLGLSADGTLGHSFRTRREELEKTLIWWRIAIIIGTGAASWYIGWIFSQGAMHDWPSVLISTIKTAPALVVLYFIINQYTKERNLAEEYAFRETIALTVRAYADQMAADEDQDRRKTIFNALEKIYVQPRIGRDSIGFFALNRTLSKNLDKTSDLLTKVLEATRPRP